MILRLITGMSCAIASGVVFLQCSIIPFFSKSSIFSVISDLSVVYLLADMRVFSMGFANNPHGKPHEKSGFKNSSKKLEKTPDFRRNPVFVWYERT